MPQGDSLFYLIGEKSGLSIPAVLIYGRDGRLRYKLTGDDPNRQYTTEDVDRAIGELLKSPD